MGNRQSVTITHQTADHGVKVKNNEANGHAMSGLDLTDAVNGEASVHQKTESSPVTVTVNTTSAAVSLEANGTQAKAPTVSGEASCNQVSATTASAEQKVPSESSTPTKGTPRMFSKMFNKKSASVSPAAEANEAAESAIINAVDAQSQNSETKPISAEANGTVAAEQKNPSESKDTTKHSDTPKMFNKMFKKKTTVSPASEANAPAEVPIVPAVETQSQKSDTDTPDIEEHLEECENVFLRWSPHHDYEVTEAAEKLTLQLVSSTQSAPMFEDLTQNTSDDEAEIIELPAMEPEALKNETNHPEEETWVLIDYPGCARDSEELVRLFSQLKIVCTENFEDFSYWKSVQIATDVYSSTDNEASHDMDSAEKDQLTTLSPDDDSVSWSEPTDIKASTQAEKGPQGEASIPSTTEITQDSTQPEDSSTEEKSVMNFFKTLVTSTKTTKEAAATPDVSKEQSQKESPPAPAANVQEASKIPPPPPPAPAKMESKAEPSVKKEEAPPVEAAATAAKEPEPPSKSKTKDSPFGKLFRTKPVLKEEAKPVEIQVDASKTSTLEASAKLEPPPAPKAEEKKAEKKPSPFANLLKPKVLLGQVSSKIHAAATSAAAGISLGAGGAGTESKKETPAAPTVPAQAAPSAKAKEEPKPAAAPAAPAAASPDNKSVESTDNSSPSTSRKLEKRNSIHQFFKNLSQKRHSDAGVQTEPVAPEKAK